MHEPIHGIKPDQIRPGQVNTGVGSSVKHDSAIKHVSGEALYTDDLPEPRDLLHIYIAQSTQAHAKILKLDLDAVKAFPGVVAVIQASDVPGRNDFGAVIDGDPIFADGLVEYVGQSLFAVAAEHIDIARKAAALAKIDYEPLPALINVRDALAADSFVLPTKTFRRGEPEAQLAQAEQRLQGEIEIGGQDHFYLESNIAMALPGEDGDLKVFSSTQHPTEIQHCCARVLGVPDHAINVEVRRMGGGFGGKESQPALFASIAALVTHHTKRPSKLRLDRDDDMTITGKRHDYVIRYDVGFDGQGRIKAIAFEAASRCGMSADLSGSINDRTMFHLDNAYYLEHVSIVSHRCKTHTVSNTAFRGFGGPQGMVAIERVIDQIACQVGKDPLDIEPIWHELYAKSNHYGHRGLALHAISAIDIALHDLAGKILGQPVHRLLGGAFRDRVPVYASALMPWTTDEVTARVSAYREQGYRAVKLGWGPIGADARQDVELVRTARAACGPDLDLMIDAGRVWTWKQALQMTRRFEEFELSWLEEPLPRPFETAPGVEMTS